MACLNRITLYVRDVDAVADFYQEHFRHKVVREDNDRLVELVPADDNGFTLQLHPLAKGRKAGQSLVKLVFSVHDVEAFCRQSARRGLVFGPIHPYPGYAFANAKDPAGNAISVSSRAYRNASENGQESLQPVQDG
ncbi:VOC family protein [Roseibium sp. RKSG952]|uniref:VOC family protein n=1 Tax=Roseibium sp. RKSG952 TaxID=2529384 RepID=UPI0012BD28F0|nr:VOC family protein [Roseibium sp. RKSG952]MTH96435.1 VOC family protein [Roseibium sp. RKSG952]